MTTIRRYFITVEYDAVAARQSAAMKDDEHEAQKYSNSRFVCMRYGITLVDGNWQCEYKRSRTRYISEGRDLPGTLIDVACH